MMTWGEFKLAVETAGIKDEDEIWYIDVTFPSKDAFESEEIVVKKGDSLGFTVG